MSANPGNALPFGKSFANWGESSLALPTRDQPRPQSLHSVTAGPIVFDGGAPRRVGQPQVRRIGQGGERLVVQHLDPGLGRRRHPGLYGRGRDRIPHRSTGQSDHPIRARGPAGRTGTGFRHQHWKSPPKQPLDFGINEEEMKKLFTGKDYKENYKILSVKVRQLGENIPPLINAYMNLSPTMRMFGTVLNDEFGDVEESGIMITINDLYEKKVERHVSTYQRVRFMLRKKPYMG